MNHLMQDANTYTKERIRTEFRARMNGCDMDFDACTNIDHVNKKLDNVQKTLRKSWKFLGRPHHPDNGGDKNIFHLYTMVHDELLDWVRGEAAVRCAIEETLICIITSVVNKVAWDQKRAEDDESLIHARSFKYRLISALLVRDDAPIPETALVAQTSNTAFTVPEATPPDTPSLPPNTVALGIFESIVTAFTTLTVPMNGNEEYKRSTITSKKIYPIRMLLQNQLIPIPSDEPDFWTILDMVDKQNIPKSTHLHKKLPSAIKFFRELRELNPSLQCTTDDVLPDALCDTTVSPSVEETIESDATPMSSLQEDAPDAPPVQEDATAAQDDASPPPDAPPVQEDASPPPDAPPVQEDASPPPDAPPVQEDASPPPDAPPVQEDASPPPDAPQQSILVKDKKHASRKNSKAKKRTKEQDVESTTEEVTRPVKMQKSNTLKCNTDNVLEAVESGKITLLNPRTGEPYASTSISIYCNKVRKLLNGEVVGVAIDPNETNPFRVLENAINNTPEAIKTDDRNRKHNGQLHAGVKFFLNPKLRRQYAF